MLGVLGILGLQVVLLLGVGGWLRRGDDGALMALLGGGSARAAGVSVWVSDGGLLRNPRGIVFDGLGNAFVAVQGTDAVTKVTAAGEVSEYATGLQNPWGVALDGAGNLYVTLVNKKELWKISPDGSRTLVASGLKNMHHLVFNPSDGLLYVTREDGVSTVNPATGAVNALWETPYPNGTDNCWGIALDAAGGFYVAMKLSRNEWLFHATPNGQGGLNTATVETDGNKIPRSLAVDALGNLYAGDNKKQLWLYPGGQGPGQLLSENELKQPFGLAVHPLNGDLYVTESTMERIAIWDLSFDGSGPVVNVLAPAGGALTSDNTPAVAVSYSDADSGVKTGALSVTVDGADVTGQLAIAAGEATGALVAPLADGPHTLTARIENLFGIPTVATSVFTVDATAPMLVVSDPSGDATVSAPVLVATGSVSDAGSAVSVAVNGQNAVLAGGAFTANVNLNEGANVLTFAATDAAGNSATAIRTVTYNPPDVTPPVVVLSTPTPGQILATNMVSIAATATDDRGVNAASVTLTLDGAAVSVTANLPSLTATASDLSNGPHTLTLNAQDSAGNAAAPATVTFTTDNTAPALSVTQPATDETVMVNSATLAGAASDAVGPVSVTLNGVAIPLYTGPNQPPSGQSFNQTLTLAEGANVYALTATDSAGHSSTVVRTITFAPPPPGEENQPPAQDTTAPSLTLTSHPMDAVVSEASVVLTGVAADDVALGNLTINGQSVALTGGNFSHAVTLAPGANVLTLLLTDAAANTAPLIRTLTYTPAAPPVETPVPVVENPPASEPPTETPVPVVEAPSTVETPVAENPPAAEPPTEAPAPVAENPPTTQPSTETPAPVVEAPPIVEAPAPVAENPPASEPSAETPAPVAENLPPVEPPVVVVENPPPAAIPPATPVADTTPPVILLTSPVSDTLTTTEAMLTITGLVSDDTGMVNLMVNGVTLATSPALPNSNIDPHQQPSSLQPQVSSLPFNNVLTLAPGSNVFVLVATDQSGNVATATLNITRQTPVDTTPPALTITAPPRDPFWLNTLSYVLEGQTEAGATVSVDETPAVVTPDGRFVMPVSLTEGNNAILVMAQKGTATGGRSARAAAPETTVLVELVADTLAPEITWLNPDVSGNLDGQSSVRVNVQEPVGSTGSGVNAQSLTLTVDGQNVLLTAAGAGGEFTAPLPLLADGAHTFVLTAQDNAGNLATSVVTMAGDVVATNTTNPPPAPTSSAPSTSLPPSFPSALPQPGPWLHGAKFAELLLARPPTQAAALSAPRLQKKKGALTRRVAASPPGEGGALTLMGAPLPPPPPVSYPPAVMLFQNASRPGQRTLGSGDNLMVGLLFAQTVNDPTVTVNLLNLSGVPEDTAGALVSSLTLSRDPQGQYLGLFQFTGQTDGAGRNVTGLVVQLQDYETVTCTPDCVGQGERARYSPPLFAHNTVPEIASVQAFATAHSQSLVVQAGDELQVRVLGTPGHGAVKVWLVNGTAQGFLGTVGEPITLAENPLFPGLYYAAVTVPAGPDNQGNPLQMLGVVASVAGFTQGAEVAADCLFTMQGVTQVAGVSAENLNRNTGAWRPGDSLRVSVSAPPGLTDITAQLANVTPLTTIHLTSAFEPGMVGAALVLTETFPGLYEGTLTVNQTSDDLGNALEALRVLVSQSASPGLNVFSAQRFGYEQAQGLNTVLARNLTRPGVMEIAQGEQYELEASGTPGLSGVVGALANAESHASPAEKQLVTSPTVLAETPPGAGVYRSAAQSLTTLSDGVGVVARSLAPLATDGGDTLLALGSGQASAAAAASQWFVDDFTGDTRQKWLVSEMPDPAGSLTPQPTGLLVDRTGAGTLKLSTYDTLSPGGLSVELSGAFELTQFTGGGSAQWALEDNNGGSIRRLVLEVAWTGQTGPDVDAVVSLKDASNTLASTPAQLPLNTPVDWTLTFEDQTPPGGVPQGFLSLSLTPQGGAPTTLSTAVTDQGLGNRSVVMVLAGETHLRLNRLGTTLRDGAFTFAPVAFAWKGLGYDQSLRSGATGLVATLLGADGQAYSLAPQAQGVMVRRQPGQRVDALLLRINPSPATSAGFRHLTVYTDMLASGESGGVDSLLNLVAATLAKEGFPQVRMQVDKVLTGVLTSQGQGNDYLWSAPSTSAPARLAERHVRGEALTVVEIPPDIESAGLAKASDPQATVVAVGDRLRITAQGQSGFGDVAAVLVNPASLQNPPEAALTGVLSLSETTPGQYETSVSLSSAVDAGGQTASQVQAAVKRFVPPGGSGGGGPVLGVAAGYDDPGSLAFSADPAPPPALADDFTGATLNSDLWQVSAEGGTTSPPPVLEEVNNRVVFDILDNTGQTRLQSARQDYAAPTGSPAELIATLMFPATATPDPAQHLSALLTLPGSCGGCNAVGFQLAVPGVGQPGQLQAVLQINGDVRFTQLTGVSVAADTPVTVKVSYQGSPAQVMYWVDQGSGFVLQHTETGFTPVAASNLGALVLATGQGGPAPANASFYLTGVGGNLRPPGKDFLLSFTPLAKDGAAYDSLAVFGMPQPGLLFGEFGPGLTPVTSTGTRVAANPALPVNGALLRLTPTGGGADALVTLLSQTDESTLVASLGPPPGYDSITLDGFASALFTPPAGPGQSFVWNPGALLPPADPNTPSPAPGSPQPQLAQNGGNYFLAGTYYQYQNQTWNDTPGWGVVGSLWAFSFQGSISTIALQGSPGGDVQATLNPNQPVNLFLYQYGADRLTVFTQLDQATLAQIPGLENPVYVQLGVFTPPATPGDSFIYHPPGAPQQHVLTAFFQNSPSPLFTNTLDIQPQAPLSTATLQKASDPQATVVVVGDTLRIAAQGQANLTDVKAALFNPATGPSTSGALVPSLLALTEAPPGSGQYAATAPLTTAQDQGGATATQVQAAVGVLTPSSGTGPVLAAGSPAPALTQPQGGGNYRLNSAWYALNGQTYNQLPGGGEGVAFIYDNGGFSFTLIPAGTDADIASLPTFNPAQPLNGFLINPGFRVTVYTQLSEAALVALLGLPGVDAALPGVLMPPSTPGEPFGYNPPIFGGGGDTLAEIFALSSSLVTTNALDLRDIHPGLITATLIDATSNSNTVTAPEHKLTIEAIGIPGLGQVYAQLINPDVSPLLEAGLSGLIALEESSIDPGKYAGQTDFIFTTSDAGKLVQKIRAIAKPFDLEGILNGATPIRLGQIPVLSMDSIPTFRPSAFRWLSQNYNQLPGGGTGSVWFYMQGNDPSLIEIPEGEAADISGVVNPEAPVDLYLISVEGIRLSVYTQIPSEFIDEISQLANADYSFKGVLIPPDSAGVAFTFNTPGEALLLINYIFLQSSESGVMSNVLEVAQAEADRHKPELTLEFGKPGLIFASPIYIRGSLVDPVPASGVNTSSVVLKIVSSEGDVAAGPFSIGDLDYDIMTGDFAKNLVLPQEGQFYVAVSASDYADNLAGAVKEIIIDNTAPILNVLSPTPNDFLRGTEQEVTLSFSDNLSLLNNAEGQSASVKIYLAGILVGEKIGIPASACLDQLNTTCALTVSINIANLSGSTQTLRVEVKDIAGNLAFSEIAVRPRSNNGPDVSIVYPVSDSVLSGISEVEATFVSPFTTKVHWVDLFVDQGTVPVASVKAQPAATQGVASFQVHTYEFFEGEHTLRAQAWFGADRINSGVSQPVPVRFSKKPPDEKDSLPPSIAVVYPISGTVLTKSEQIIRLTIGDDRRITDTLSSGVNITLAGVPLVATNGIRPEFCDAAGVFCTLIFPVNIANIPNVNNSRDDNLELTIAGRDASGNTRTVTMSVSVRNNTGPVVTITTPMEGQAFSRSVPLSVLIQVPSDLGKKVRFVDLFKETTSELIFLDTIDFGSNGIVEGTADFLVDPEMVGEGETNLVVKAYLKPGRSEKIGQDSVTIRLDQTSPRLRLVASRSEPGGIVAGSLVPKTGFTLPVSVPPRSSTIFSIIWPDPMISVMGTLLPESRLSNISQFKDTVVDLDIPLDSQSGNFSYMLPLVTSQSIMTLAATETFVDYEVFPPEAKSGSTVNIFSVSTFETIGVPAENFGGMSGETLTASIATTFFQTPNDVITYDGYLEEDPGNLLAALFDGQSLEIGKDGSVHVEISGLNEGFNTKILVAVDKAGNVSAIVFTIQKTPPLEPGEGSSGSTPTGLDPLVLTTPEIQKSALGDPLPVTTSASSVLVTGHYLFSKVVRINGQAVKTSPNPTQKFYDFHKNLTFLEGLNTITVSSFILTPDPNHPDMELEHETDHETVEVLVDQSPPSLTWVNPGVDNRYDPLTDFSLEVIDPGLHPSGISFKGLKVDGQTVLLRDSSRELGRLRLPLTPSHAPKEFIFSALDAVGNRTEETRQVTVVDTTPPGFGLISPRSLVHDTLDDDYIIRIGLEEGSVLFFVDNGDETELSRDTEGIFNHPVTLALGENTFYFKAVDDWGNEAQLTLHLNKLLPPPPIALSNPVAGQSFEEGAYIQVSGVTLAGAKVGVGSNETVADQDGLFRLSVPATWGLTHLTVWVHAENHFPNQAEVDIEVTDSTIPAISFISPTSGQIFAKDAPVGVEVETEPSATVHINGIRAAGNFRVNRPDRYGISLRESHTGPYLITAEVTDKAGNTAFANVTVAKQLPPGPSPLTLSFVLAPVDGGLTSSESVLVSVRVITGLTDLEFVEINDVRAISTSSDTFTSIVALQLGQNTIKAAALDKDGRLVSVQRQVTRVDQSPPGGITVFEFTSHETGDSFTSGTQVTIEGRADMDIDLSLNGAPITRSPGAQEFTTQVTLLPGENVFSLTASKPNGSDPPFTKNIRLVLYGLILEEIRAIHPADGADQISNQPLIVLELIRPTGGVTVASASLLLDGKVAKTWGTTGSRLEFKTPEALVQGKHQLTLVVVPAGATYEIRKSLSFTTGTVTAGYSIQLTSPAENANIEQGTEVMVSGQVTPLGGAPMPGTVIIYDAEYALASDGHFSVPQIIDISGSVTISASVSNTKSMMKAASKTISVLPAPNFTSRIQPEFDNEVHTSHCKEFGVPGRKRTRCVVSISALDGVAGSSEELWGTKIVIQNHSLDTNEDGEPDWELHVEGLEPNDKGVFTSQTDMFGRKLFVFRLQRKIGSDSGGNFFMAFGCENLSKAGELFVLNDNGKNRKNIKLVSPDDKIQCEAQRIFEGSIEGNIRVFLYGTGQKLGSGFTDIRQSIKEAGSLDVFVALPEADDSDESPDKQNILSTQFKNWDGGKITINGSINKSITTNNQEVEYSQEFGTVHFTLPEVALPKSSPETPPILLLHKPRALDQCKALTPENTPDKDTVQGTEFLDKMLGGDADSQEDNKVDLLDLGALKRVVSAIDSQSNFIEVENCFSKNEECADINGDGIVEKGEYGKDLQLLRARFNRKGDTADFLNKKCLLGNAYFDKQNNDDAPEILAALPKENSIVQLSANANNIIVVAPFSQKVVANSLNMLRENGRHVLSYMPSFGLHEVTISVFNRTGMVETKIIKFTREAPVFFESKNIQTNRLTNFVSIGSQNDLNPGNENVPLNIGVGEPDCDYVGPMEIDDGKNKSEYKFLFFKKCVLWAVGIGSVLNQGKLGSMKLLRLLPPSAGGYQFKGRFDDKRVLIQKNEELSNKLFIFDLTTLQLLPIEIESNCAYDFVASYKTDNIFYTECASNSTNLIQYNTKIKKVEVKTPLNGMIFGLLPSPRGAITKFHSLGSYTIPNPPNINLDESLVWNESEGNKTVEILSSTENEEGLLSTSSSSRWGITTTESDLEQRLELVNFHGFPQSMSKGLTQMPNINSFPSFRIFNLPDRSIFSRFSGATQ